MTATVYIYVKTSVVMYSSEDRNPLVIFVAVKVDVGCQQEVFSFGPFCIIMVDEVA